jgi:peptidoglycan/xylan/chitin deacetylase (PgdA/CDA1 family)
LSILGTTLARTVKRLSIAVDRVVPPRAGITMLIYHRVGGASSGAVDLDAGVFDDQLAYLVAHHRVIPLQQAITELTAPSTGVPGQPAVVITFDDGTRDFSDSAVPALVRHNLPATLFVATEFIDTGNEFPWGAPPTSWAALRDAHATGLISIGSHTHSHWLLDRLDAAAIAQDLDRSIELIGSNIGVRPDDFAYPKAVPGSPAAEIEVRKRFRSAALAANRVNRPGQTDLHRLWRTPVQRSDSSQYFAAKARGGMRLEGELRSIVGRVRFRGDDR